MLFRSNDTATTEIYTRPYTLSLHDALPIFAAGAGADGVIVGTRMIRAVADGEDVEALVGDFAKALAST